MKKILLVLAAILLLSIEFGCRKKSKENPIVSNTDTSSVTLKKNVFIIDSTTLKLVSTETELANGDYIFFSTSGFPSFLDGGIIVGCTGEGYLRKIVSISVQPGKVKLSTSEASLEDVISEGEFTISTDIEGLAEKPGHKSTAGADLSLSVSDHTIYEDGVSRMSIQTASVSLSIEPKITPKFIGGKLAELDVTMEGEYLTDMQLNIAVTSAHSLNAKDTVKKMTKRQRFFIGELPVLLVEDFYLIAEVEGNISGKYEKTMTVAYNSPFKVGAKFTNGVWEKTSEITTTRTFTTHDTGGVNSGLVVTIRPQVNLRIYGIAGPYTSLPVRSYVNGHVALPSKDWDVEAGVYLQPTIGVSGKLFSYSLGDYNTYWTTDSLSYQTPFYLQKISYENDMVKVRVLDNINGSQSKVPVYFEIISGGGRVHDNTVFTDDNGYATTKWILGTSTGEKKLSVSAKKANGELVSGTPVLFTSADSTQDSLYIGKPYQGGVIAYIFQASDPGYNPSQKHGLVVAENVMGSLPTTYEWWNGSFIVTGAVGTAIGTGMTNTTTIVTAQGPGGVVWGVKEMVKDGYDDWFIPSKDELNKIYQSISTVPGFAGAIMYNTGPYVSSSEYDDLYALGQSFSDGSQIQLLKSGANNVFAIRYF